MTSLAELTAIDTGAGLHDNPRCSACDHDARDHDAIGQRYCEATQANALPRGCICRSA